MWHEWPCMVLALVYHSLHLHCWPTSRQPPNPTMAVNFAWPCTPCARSTRTITELAGVDGMRVLKDTSAPGAGTTHLVAKLVSYPQAMMGGDTNSEYTKLAYSLNSNSDLSKEEQKPRGCKCKKSQRLKSCNRHETQKKDKDNEPK